ncbi:MAG: DNA-directed RNA polymerase subunit beta [Coriobacteriia bacterium]|nr:DNA-directed RNA polymerase subunit beta [Coriobacteriia bacterium]
MARKKSKPNFRVRKSFAKIPEAMEMPNLIGVQTQSFDWFMSQGVRDVLADMSPTESTTKNMLIEFGECRFDEPKFSIEECKDKDVSYQVSMYVQLTFVNCETGETKEQEVFLGDFPKMTPSGTFIINGTERVVVSQLVRSPGVYYNKAKDKTSSTILYDAKLIPDHGAWLEYETDKNERMYVHIDRRGKIEMTKFIRALGIAETNDEIIKMFGNNKFIQNTLEKDKTANQAEALIEIYKKFRPGEPPTVEAAKSLLERLFFNRPSYNLAGVGRYKINKKLGFEEDFDSPILTDRDIVESIKYFVSLAMQEEGFTIDDIDHFGNRRIRTVGELIQNQFRMGFLRTQRIIRDRMSNIQDPDEIVPQKLINIRPIEAAMKEFFGSSQLSQFMDQTNPASGITHKRRLSALGPGGLSRERAGMEVRDVHTSHYGRMCPIETPEGPNIGLIGSLAAYARINPYGFIETPYRRVKDGKVTKDVDYLPADEEEKYTIAQANESFDEKTGEFGSVDNKGKFVAAKKVLCRTMGSHGDYGEPDEVAPKDVDYMDISPRQMVSVATSLIPFLEHDDANRALMGSNMQRQAVPLMKPHAPLVGTGIERRIAVDSGEVLTARADGVVDYVDGSTIIIENKDGEFDEYIMPKFKRSNQSTCNNHRPLVKPGDKIKAGDVLADGPSCEGAELALGQNLMVAYMPWEGYNYEDAIIVSERVVSEDLLTSIHISEYEIDARDTKLGSEEITREIPNVSEEMISNLDEDGIIRIGAEVKPGDILVGKVTPKGETELTAEERLLRAIFGEKAREVRDTSLKVLHGGGGYVVDILEFSRDNGDDLPPGVNKLIKVFVAQKRKIQQGDKLSGRHGNKGVISNVLPVEDMPYLADGTPIDVILNPLGVPSRMNVGQLLENHLGWAALWGWNDDEKDESIADGPIHVSSPVFDGADENEIQFAIGAANKNLLKIHNKKYGKFADETMVPQLSETGKTWLYDGRTGEKFREPITVGQSYILKLGHMVDDKIHARSTGPYSLITQQPLGGKAQFGGQRFGEMEVWALYAYGASNVLQEILTIKSDDTKGRVKAYENIVQGKALPTAEVPESFKVLIKEMKSLGLNVELKGEQPEEQEKSEDLLDAVQEETTEDVDLTEELENFEEDLNLEGDLLIDDEEKGEE